MMTKIFRFIPLLAFGLILTACGTNHEDATEGNSDDQSTTEEVVENEAGDTKACDKPCKKKCDKSTDGKKKCSKDKTCDKALNDGTSKDVDA